MERRVDLNQLNSKEAKSEAVRTGARRQRDNQANSSSPVC